MIDAGLDPVTVAGVLWHEDPHITLKTYAARFNRQRKDEAVRLALAGSGALQDPLRVECSRRRLRAPFSYQLKA